jgi:voltage-gated potassium channel
VSSTARLRLSILLLIALVGCGVAGYVHLEGFTILEALYMTVITLSTTGFTEVHPLSPAGRMFTIGLIVVGVTTVGYIISSTVGVVIVEASGEALARKRMEKRMQALRDHYIICGYGRMGQVISREFAARRIPFVVIDPNPARIRMLAEQRLAYVEGSAAEDDVLTHAGVLRARGLVAVAPTDADNIFIVLSARALNPKLFIVARSIYVEDEHKLRRAGADRVISPYVIGARRMAAAVFHPHVVDFLDLEIHRPEMEWEMEDIAVGPGAAFLDRTLRDSRIREVTGCMVVAIRPKAVDNHPSPFVSNPSPDTILRDGDTLIVLGTTTQLTALERMAGMREDS